MFIMFCILLWVIFDCMQAIGKDWQQSEENADRRANAIIGTIEDSTNYTCHYISEENEIREKRFYRYLQQIEDDKPVYQNGKKMRRRTMYDEHGNVIAEEIIEGFEE